MKQIRLGMVGYGFRGSGLFKLAKSVESLVPTAICDTNSGGVAEIRADFPDVAFFDDFNDMLDSDRIDALLIETPPATHATFAVAALERNIHVLCDVPVLHRLEEVQPLWDAAEKSNAVYMFGSNANYWDFVGQLSELRKKGLIGTPFYMEAEYVHDITEFAKTTPWRQGYEPIRYCTHSLGPTLEWLGDELISVSSLDTGSHVHPEKEGHDAMVAIFRSRSNAVVKLMVSFTNSLPFGSHRYLCHGTEGYFDCTWPLTGGEPEVRYYSKKEDGPDHLISLDVSSAPPVSADLKEISGFGAVDFAMLEDFARASGGGPCRIDLKQGLRMTLPGLYALESAKRGGELMEISYPWE